MTAVQFNIQFERQGSAAHAGAGLDFDSFAVAGHRAIESLDDADVAEAHLAGAGEGRLVAERGGELVVEYGQLQRVRPLMEPSGRTTCLGLGLPSPLWPKVLPPVGGAMQV